MITMLSLSILAGFATVGVAQYSGWDITNGQVASWMCTWQGPQAAVIRDTLYMDGGNLYWRPRLSDESWGQATQDDKKFGNWALSLNFSTPFNVSSSQNISALFTPIYKGPTAPLFYDGAMLANDYEYLLFGGSVAYSNLGSDPADDQGLKYMLYNDGIDETAFAVGYVSYDIEEYGNLTTRNVTSGAAANVPSENLAFYFSGLHSPTFELTVYPAASVNQRAVNASNSLISLDLSIQNQETWTNYTLPDSIPGRASPELVWVPVGEQGILVALGGVLYPEYGTVSRRSPNITGSLEESPKFMTNIDIYDIANSTWYTQSTTGGPGALTQGCAVVQPAADRSSFNIYWYGGYDGLNASDANYWNNAVWVLSLPSFTWLKAADGPDSKPRAGHRCVMPYPDQMMVIGGTTAQAGDSYVCLDEIIQLFNVSSATWLDTYDPTVWSNYSVPKVIYDAIGGDGSGSATTTKPSSWNNTALGDVFQTTYDTSKITTYYPYNAVTTSGSGTNPTITPGSKDNSSSNVPKYLAPVLGVILGLIFISSIVVVILLWRRRRLLKKNGGVSVVSSDEHGGRIMSWINGQQPRGAMAAKAETVTTSDEMTDPRSLSPDMGLRYTQRPAFTSYYEQQHGSLAHEMHNNEIVELPANPQAAELSDAPMTPGDIVDRTFGRSPGRHGSSFGYSSLQQTDQGSMVSSASFARNAPGPPAPPSSTSHGAASVISTQPQQEVRPDSTALPTPLARDLANKDLPELPASPNRRVDSDVSAFSERERAHLRNTSDSATVSTMDATISSPPPSQMNAGHRVASPPIMEEGTMKAANAQPPGMVSPPTDGTAEGQDYVGARVMHGLVSPVEGRVEPARPGSSRRSVFRESAEDMDGSRRP